MTEVRYSISSGAWPGEPHPDGTFFAASARKTEELGFYGLFAGDHLVVDNPIPEALTTLATYAAVTERIKIGPMVLLLALRPLIPTVKQLATLDVLSRGRLITGVGVGGEVEKEWQACGVSTKSRGKRTDAYLEAMTPLMTGETITRDNKFVSLEDVDIRPSSVQDGGPPVWIGGRSDAALERASRHQGWIAYAESARAFGEKTGKLKELLGGDDSGFKRAYMIFGHIGETREKALAKLTPILAERYGEYFTKYIDAFCAVGTKEEVADRVGEYIDGGATDIIVYPQCHAAEFTEQLELFADALQVSPAAPGAGT